MCDADTERDNLTFLAGTTRRQLQVGVGAAAVLGAAGCSTSSKVTSSSSSAATKVTGNRVRIPTPDGEAEGWFTHPADGTHPGVLIWPDVAGLRPAFETMADRLASAGYAVLAVNPYYRSSALPILETFSEWRTEEGKAKIAPMRELLTADNIARDAAAYIDWLDAQPGVDDAQKLGTTGYCMGGPFTFRTAAARTQRVGAFASFHGGGLVTEAPDSPHQLLEKVEAAALVCIAQNDDARDPEAKDKLREAAKAEDVTAEVEVYPAQHGWCVIDSPVYDPTQAERAWSRLLATFSAHL